MTDIAKCELPTCDAPATETTRYILARGTYDLNVCHAHVRATGLLRVAISKFDADQAKKEGTP